MALAVEVSVVFLLTDNCQMRTSNIINHNLKQLLLFLLTQIVLLCELRYNGLIIRIFMNHQPCLHPIAETHIQTQHYCACLLWSLFAQTFA